MVCLVCFSFRGVMLFVYGNDISQYFIVSIFYFIISEQVGTRAIDCFVFLCHHVYLLICGRL